MTGLPPQQHITVAVCTFRRASLTATLKSIAAQTLELSQPLRVIVADNDVTDTRRVEIEDLGESLQLNLQYLHAPCRNISIARNACLQNCQTRFLAFIDDDEIAEPNWLEDLVRKMGDSQFVFGPCEAVYPRDTPKWIRMADMHSNRLSDGDADWNGYTSNVLIDVDFVGQQKLRFSEMLGQSGGEDTYFFFQAKQLGAKFGYAGEAKVLEPVNPNRLSFSWAAKRRFRSGQVHYMILKSQANLVRGVIGAVFKAMFCFVSAPAFGLRWREPLLRGLLHAGVVAHAIGIPLYAEYASPVNLSPKSAV